MLADANYSMTCVWDMYGAGQRVARILEAGRGGGRGARAAHQHGHHQHGHPRDRQLARATHAARRLQEGPHLLRHAGGTSDCARCCCCDMLPCRLGGWEALHNLSFSSTVQVKEIVCCG